MRHPDPHPDRPRQRLGSYELLDVIGRGAMGVVYRARHVESGEAVALKTLEKLEPDVLDSLRREIHVLSGLQHPGVVAIRAHAVEDATPWYAMQFVEGQPLDRYGIAEGRPFQRRTELLRALQRLCSALAFLHGEGVVHRDLKPENVIVTPEGQPVLVDFGLVSRFGGISGRESLEVGGEILGTVDYMAPEQARGEYVDARADLYALGCVLYQLVTGRPPFDGEVFEVLEKHLEQVPEPPSRLALGVPPALDELIQRLLAKDPRERPGFAADVAEVLASLTPDGREPDARPARTYLYRPAFAGRAHQLGHLRNALQAALEGRGLCVFLVGESGAGKTRLAMEATREASSRGFHVVTGECLPLEGGGGRSQARGAPLHPLRPLLLALRDHCHAAGPEATRAIFGSRAGVLAPYIPELAELPGLEAVDPPAPLPADAARARLVRDLVESVRAYAEREPLLLVLDDLQWADEITLSVLAALRDGFTQPTRIVVIGTYRSEEADEAVLELGRGALALVLELERIDRSVVDEIVSGMLALRPAPPALVRFLAEQSEGNPFFVAEYLRAAVEAELLQRTGVGVWEIATEGRAEDAGYDALPLPLTLRRLVGRRLEALSSAARAVLEAAAVLGREFDLELVARLSGHDAGELVGASAELLHRRVLHELGGRQFRFAHDKLREVAYERIDSDRQVGLHRIAAEAIEAGCQGQPDAAWPAAVLAHHWERAGIEPKALLYYGRAGESALETGAHQQARRLLGQALELDRRIGGALDRVERARWLRLLGEACLGTGDLESAIEHTSAGIASLGRRVPHGTAGWLGVLALEGMRQLGSLARSPRDRPGEGAADPMLECALASGLVAAGYYFQFRMLPGVASSLRCVNLAARARRPSVAALSSAQLGYIAGGLRLHRIARAYFERAHASDSDRDPTAYGAALYWHAMYEMGLGHWTESERFARDAAALLERIRNPQEAEIALTALANTLYLEGRLREAEQICATIVETAEQRANSQHTGWGFFLMGRSRAALGDSERALELLERGYASLRRVPDVVSLVICEGLLAHARLAAGQTRPAEELAEQMSERRRGRGIVPLAQCLDGYRSLADVRLALWARARPAEADSRRRAAQRACTDLRRFARIFPIAQPAALRASAREDWVGGHRGRAITRWRRSAARARQLEMPYDELLARLDLVRLDPEGSVREPHAGRIEKRRRELGCVATPSDPFQEVAVTGGAR